MTFRRFDIDWRFSAFLRFTVKMNVAVVEDVNSVAFTVVVTISIDLHRQYQIGFETPPMQQHRKLEPIFSPNNPVDRASFPRA